VLGLVALTEVTNVLAEIGVIFLLFNVGLDPRRRDALRQPRAAVPLGQRLVGGGGPRTLLGRGGALSVPAARGRLTFPAARVNASKEIEVRARVAAGC
jgi:hypothetical protein